jgi:hypothetical protein
VSPTRHVARTVARVLPKSCSRWTGALLAATACPERQGAVQAASEPGAPGGAQVLALHLLVEAARGAASFWAAYLAQLPRAHSCLSYFGAAEADALQVPPAVCVLARTCTSAHKRSSLCSSRARCCKREGKQRRVSGLRA